MLGAVRSICTGPNEPLPVLPAMSLQLPFTVVGAVCPENTVFPVIEFGSGPESVSLQLKVTVTGTSFVHTPGV